MGDHHEDRHQGQGSDANYLVSFDHRKLQTGDTAAFASAMLSFVRENRRAADALIAGNVQMLGFEVIKKRLGQQWPSVRDKVHLLTEGVIKKHISAEDVYCQLGDDRFIVLFGRAARSQALYVARRIGHEITTRLSGSTAPSDVVSVRPVIFEVPRDDPAALRSPAAFATSVQDAQRRAQLAETAKFEAATEHFALRFWPVANVRKRLVSCYHAELHAPAGVDVGFELDGASDTGALEAAIDRLVLRKVGAALVESATQRCRATLIAPVRYETLATRGYRSGYLEACRLLPRIAETRLFLIVHGLSDGVPQSRLRTLFAYLAPFVAGFIGDFSLAFRRTESLAGLQIAAIGVNGNSVAAATAKDVEALDGFVAGTLGCPMRRYFYGASTVEVATAARRARFDYVQGSGVAPAVPVPGKVFRI